MRIGRSEAFDILKKWLNEKTLVRCRVHLPAIAIGMQGRTFSIRGEHVTVADDDRITEVNIRLANDVSFGYGDTRNSPTEIEAFDLVLVGFFGPVPEQGQPDMVSLSSFREPN